MAADGNGGHIQKDAVVIGIKTVADGDLTAIVTAEGGLNAALIPHGAQQLAQDIPPLLQLAWEGVVIAAAQGLGPQAGGGKRRVPRQVQAAGQHVFQLGHKKPPLRAEWRFIQ